jgi:hypothetical protein
MKTAVQIAQEIKKHKPIDKTNVMYDETWEDYLRGRNDKSSNEWREEYKFFDAFEVKVDIITELSKKMR